MAYSTNPNLPKARATAMRLALAIVARKCGYRPQYLNDSSSIAIVHRVTTMLMSWRAAKR